MNLFLQFKLSTMNFIYLKHLKNQWNFNVKLVICKINDEAQKEQGKFPLHN